MALVKQRQLFVFTACENCADQLTSRCAVKDSALSSAGGTAGNRWVPGSRKAEECGRQAVPNEWPSFRRPCKSSSYTRPPACAYAWASMSPPLRLATLEDSTSRGSMLQPTFEKEGRIPCCALFTGLPERTFVRMTAIIMV
jgi:hypothetical protein